MKLYHRFSRPEVSLDVILSGSAACSFDVILSGRQATKDLAGVGRNVSERWVSLSKVCRTAREILHRLTPGSG
jgi:hypothetical protein